MFSFKKYKIKDGVVYPFSDDESLSIELTRDGFGPLRSARHERYVGDIEAFKTYNKAIDFINGSELTEAKKLRDRLADAANRLAADFNAEAENNKANIAAWLANLDRIKEQQGLMDYVAKRQHNKKVRCAHLYRLVQQLDEAITNNNVQDMVQGYGVSQNEDSPYQDPHAADIQNVHPANRFAKLSNPMVRAIETDVLPYISDHLEEEEAFVEDQKVGFFRKLLTGFVFSDRVFSSSLTFRKKQGDHLAFEQHQLKRHRQGLAESQAVRLNHLISDDLPKDLAQKFFASCVEHGKYRLYQINFAQQAAVIDGLKAKIDEYRTSRRPNIFHRLAAWFGGETKTYRNWKAEINNLVFSLQEVSAIQGDPAADLFNDAKFGAKFRQVFVGTPLEHKDANEIMQSLYHDDTRAHYAVEIEKLIAREERALVNNNSAFGRFGRWARGTSEAYNDGQAYLVYLRNLKTFLEQPGPVICNQDITIVDDSAAMTEFVAEFNQRQAHRATQAGEKPELLQVRNGKPLFEHALDRLLSSHCADGFMKAYSDFRKAKNCKTIAELRQAKDQAEIRAAEVESEQAGRAKQQELMAESVRNSREKDIIKAHFAAGHDAELKALLLDFLEQLQTDNDSKAKTANNEVKRYYRGLNQLAEQLKVNLLSNEMTVAEKVRARFKAVDDDFGTAMETILHHGVNGRNHIDGVNYDNFLKMLPVTERYIQTALFVVEQELTKDASNKYYLQRQQALCLLHGIVTGSRLDVLNEDEVALIEDLIPSERLAHELNEFGAVSYLAGLYTRHHLKQAFLTTDEEYADKVSAYKKFIAKHNSDIDIEETYRLVAAEAEAYFSALTQAGNGHEVVFFTKQVAEDAKQLEGVLLDVDELVLKAKDGKAAKAFVRKNSEVTGELYSLRVKDIEISIPAVIAQYRRVAHNDNQHALLREHIDGFLYGALPAKLDRLIKEKGLIAADAKAEIEAAYKKDLLIPYMKTCLNSLKNQMQRFDGEEVVPVFTKEQEQQLLEMLERNLGEFFASALYQSLAAEYQTHMPSSEDAALELLAQRLLPTGERLQPRTEGRKYEATEAAVRQAIQQHQPKYPKEKIDTQVTLIRATLDRARGDSVEGLKQHRQRGHALEGFNGSSANSALLFREIADKAQMAEWMQRRYQYLFRQDKVQLTKDDELLLEHKRTRIHDAANACEYATFNQVVRDYIRAQADNKSPLYAWDENTQNQVIERYANSENRQEYRIKHICELLSAGRTEVEKQGPVYLQAQAYIIGFLQQNPILPDAMFDSYGKTELSKNLDYFLVHLRAQKEAGQPWNYTAELVFRHFASEEQLQQLQLLKFELLLQHDSGHSRDYLKYLHTGEQLFGQDDPEQYALAKRDKYSVEQYEFKTLADDSIHREIDDIMQRHFAAKMPGVYDLNEVPAVEVLYRHIFASEISVWTNNADSIFTALSNEQASNHGKERLRSLRSFKIVELLQRGVPAETQAFIDLVNHSIRPFTTLDLEQIETVFAWYQNDNSNIPWNPNAAQLIEEWGTEERKDLYRLKRIKELLQHGDATLSEAFLIDMMHQGFGKGCAKPLVSHETALNELRDLLTEYAAKKPWNHNVSLWLEQCAALAEPAFPNKLIHQYERARLRELLFDLGEPLDHALMDSDRFPEVKYVYGHTEYAPLFDRCESNKYVIDDRKNNKVSFAASKKLFGETHEDLAQLRAIFAEAIEYAEKNGCQALSEDALDLINKIFTKAIDGKGAEVNPTDLPLWMTWTKVLKAQYDEAVTVKTTVKEIVSYILNQDVEGATDKVIYNQRMTAQFSQSEDEATTEKYQRLLGHIEAGAVEVFRGYAAYLRSHHFGMIRVLANIIAAPKSADLPRQMSVRDITQGNEALQAKYAALRECEGLARARLAAELLAEMPVNEYTSHTLKERLNLVRGHLFNRDYFENIHFKGIDNPFERVPEVREYATLMPLNNPAYLESLKAYVNAVCDNVVEVSQFKDIAIAFVGNLKQIMVARNHQLVVQVTKQYSTVAERADSPQDALAVYLPGYDFASWLNITSASGDDLALAKVQLAQLLQVFKATHQDTTNYIDDILSHLDSYDADVMKYVVVLCKNMAQGNTFNHADKVRRTTAQKLEALFEVLCQGEYVVQVRQVAAELTERAKDADGIGAIREVVSDFNEQLELERIQRATETLAGLTENHYGVEGVQIAYDEKQATLSYLKQLKEEFAPMLQTEQAKQILQLIEDKHEDIYEQLANLLDILDSVGAEELDDQAVTKLAAISSDDWTLIYLGLDKASKRQISDKVQQLLAGRESDSRLFKTLTVVEALVQLGPNDERAEKLAQSGEFAAEYQERYLNLQRYLRDLQSNLSPRVNIATSENPVYDLTCRLVNEEGTGLLQYFSDDAHLLRDALRQALVDLIPVVEAGSTFEYPVGKGQRKFSVFGDLLAKISQWLEDKDSIDLTELAKLEDNILAAFDLRQRALNAASGKVKKVDEADITALGFKSMDGTKHGRDHWLRREAIHNVLNIASEQGDDRLLYPFYQLIKQVGSEEQQQACTGMMFDKSSQELIQRLHTDLPFDCLDKLIRFVKEKGDEAGKIDKFFQNEEVALKFVALKQKYAITLPSYGAEMIRDIEARIVGLQPELNNDAPELEQAIEILTRNLAIDKSTIVYYKGDSPNYVNFRKLDEEARENAVGQTVAAFAKVMVLGDADTAKAVRHQLYRYLMKFDAVKKARIDGSVSNSTDFAIAIIKRLAPQQLIDSSDIIRSAYNHTTSEEPNGEATVGDSYTNLQMATGEPTRKLRIESVAELAAKPVPAEVEQPTGTVPLVGSVGKDEVKPQASVKDYGKSAPSEGITSWLSKAVSEAGTALTGALKSAGYGDAADVVADGEDSLEGLLADVEAFADELKVANATVARSKPQSVPSPAADLLGNSMETAIAPDRDAQSRRRAASKPNPRRTRSERHMPKEADEVFPMDGFSNKR